MIEPGWPLAGLLLVLAAAAAAVTRVAGLGQCQAPVTATLRAVVQLAVVSLIIVAVLRSLSLTALFLTAMIAVAAGTSARRITGSVLPAAPWLALPMLAGVLPVMVLALGTRVVPVDPIAVLPSAGILVGGAMTATTLAGRRATEELASQHGGYDAALALGFTRRQSVGLVGRPAAGLALVPGLDQTRTVGLVTLPGAFVGVLLAGESPAQAGAAQAFVLVALLAVQAVAVAITLELVAIARILPPELHLQE